MRRDIANLGGGFKYFVFDPDKPIRCGPQVLQPIMITPDKIWVENLHDIQKGSLLVQDRFKGSLPELFEAFTLQWQQRWDRHADLPFVTLGGFGCTLPVYI